MYRCSATRSFSYESIKERFTIYFITQSGMKHYTTHIATSETYKYYTMKVMAIKAKQYTAQRRLKLFLLTKVIVFCFDLLCRIERRSQKERKIYFIMNYIQNLLDSAVAFQLSCFSLSPRNDFISSLVDAQRCELTDINLCALGRMFSSHFHFMFRMSKHEIN